jgi:TP901 family phage tail tape measure protein
MPNVIGIVIKTSAQGAIKSVERLGSAFTGLGRRIRALEKPINASKVTVRSLAFEISRATVGINMVFQGVQQLAIGVKDSLLGVLKTSADFEVAMTRVAIVIGKIGDKADDPKLVKAFDQISDRIEKIARDSEFTGEEAAAAFTNLKQAGLETAEVMKVIDQVMAFSSASAGTVNLAEAANTATSAMAAFGIEAEEANEFIDQMVKAQSITKVSMEEFGPLFRSMASAQRTFSGTTKEEALAVASVFRQMGRSAKESGRDVEGLGRGMSNIFRAIIPAGGKITAKSRRRLFALKQLGFDKSDFVDTAGEIKSMVDILNTGNDKIQLAQRRLGGAKLQKFLTQAFGSQQIKNIFLQAGAFVKQKGPIEALVEQFKDAKGLAKAAQDAFLDTFTGQMKKLEGSVGALKKSVGDNLQDLFKPFVEDAIKWANALTDFLKENPKVVKAILLVTSVVLGLTLAMGSLLVVATMATATFQFLTPVLTLLSSQFTVATIAASAFQTALLPLALALAPFLWMMLKISFVAGLFFIAYKKNFVGVKTFIDKWVKDIRTAFRFIFPILSGKGILLTKWNKFSKRTQDIIVGLRIFVTQVKAFGAGLKEGFVIGLAPTIFILKWFLIIVIKVTKGIEKLMFAYFGWGKANLQAGKSQKTLGKILGGLVGVLISAYITIKLVIVTVKVLTVVFNALRAVIIVTKAAWILFHAVITFFGPLIMAKVVPALLVLISKFIALKAATLLSVGVFALLIVAIVIAIFHWDELSVAINRTLGEWEKSNSAVKRHLSQFNDLKQLEDVSIIPETWFASIKAAATEFGLFFGNIPSVLATAAIAIFTFFEQVGTVIVSAWVNLPENMFNSGVNIIKALIDGVKSAMPELEDTVNEIAESIKDRFPFSPAKVGPLSTHTPIMAGQNIAHQLGLGLQEGSPLAATGATSLAGEVVSSLIPSEGSSFKSIKAGGEEGGAFASSLAPPVVGVSSSSEGGSKTGGEVKIDVVVNTGDFLMNISSFSAEAAQEFSNIVSTVLNDTIEQELRARNLVGV